MSSLVSDTCYFIRDPFFFLYLLSAYFLSYYFSVFLFLYLFFFVSYLSLYCFFLSLSFLLCFYLYFPCVVLFSLFVLSLIHFLLILCVHVLLTRGLQADLSLGHNYIHNAGNSKRTFQGNNRAYPECIQPGTFDLSTYLFKKEVKDSRSTIGQCTICVYN